MSMMKLMVRMNVRITVGMGLTPPWVLKASMIDDVVCSYCVSFNLRCT